MSPPRLTDSGRLRLGYKSAQTGGNVARIPMPVSSNATT
jgi:hypothetical protein